MSCRSDARERTRSFGRSHPRESIRKARKLMSERTSRIDTPVTSPFRQSVQQLGRTRREVPLGHRSNSDRSAQFLLAMLSQGAAAAAGSMVGPPHSTRLP